MSKPQRSQWHLPPWLNFVVHSRRSKEQASLQSVGQAISFTAADYQSCIQTNSRASRREKSCLFTIPCANAAKRSGSLEAEVSEQLTAFERGSFSLDREIRGLDERGINNLREQLAISKRECTEKIKRLLHQHYPAFISASKVSGCTE